MTKKDDDQIELLIEKFRWLRLPGMAGRVREILELAATKNLTGLEITHMLADEEKASRIRSAIHRSVTEAKSHVRHSGPFRSDFGESQAPIVRSARVVQAWHSGAVHGEGRRDTRSGVRSENERKTRDVHTA